MISPKERYEVTAGFWEGDFSTFKTCSHCEGARQWMINETDWPDDIDGDGHQFFFTQLRDHLMEQAREGSAKFKFRAYRHVVLMDRRRKAYAAAYNAETVRIRDAQEEAKL